MQENITQKKFYSWLISVFLFVGSILFFLGGPDYESPRSFKAFWDLGHIVYFALLTLLLTKWGLITRLSVTKRWISALSITLVLGLLIEILQYGTQRVPDLWDIIRNLTGCFIVLAFSPAYSSTKTQQWRISIKGLAVIALLGQLSPLAISLTDEAIARQQFPVLSEFETAFEKDRWTGDANRETKIIPSISSNNILEVSLSTIQYSGIALKYFPGDWRNYQLLKIRIFHPEKTPLSITCRIHDFKHTLSEQKYDDRFNRSFTLSQGWNEIEIDLNEVAFALKNRKMDMSQIRGLGIFAISLPRPQVIYLDKIHLSN